MLTSNAIDCKSLLLPVSVSYLHCIYVIDSSSNDKGILLSKMLY